MKVAFLSAAHCERNLLRRCSRSDAPASERCSWPFPRGPWEREKRLLEVRRRDSGAKVDFPSARIAKATLFGVTAMSLREE
jgi:hypothetical protein